MVLKKKKVVNEMHSLNLKKKEKQSASLSYQLN